jgi:hypothetical protein
VTRLAALLAVLAVLGATALLVAGCGRSRPDDSAATTPEQGDPTGAFGGDGEGLEGTIRVAGAPSGLKLVELAGRDFRKEEPGVAVSAQGAPVEDAIGRLCSGRLDVAAVDRPLSAAERKACEARADGAVELHVADAPGGRPVTLVTTNEVLFERFEVEGLLQYTLDDAERLAREAGLEPLSVDELDEAQTAFEQALAGI